MICFRPFLVVFFFLFTATTNTQAAALIYEATRINTKINGVPMGLEAFIAKPDVAGRLPVVLITHGSSETPEKLSAQEELGNWALDFAARGYLAVAVLRRGHGNSDGVVNQAGGTCKDPTLAQLLRHDADDLQAALTAIAARPDADMSKVIAIGQSRGGAGMIALSARPDVHLSAVISVSGGVYRTDEGGKPLPYHVFDDCQPYRADLIDTIGAYADAARMPQLWVYAQNDPWFGQDFVDDMTKAWKAHGGSATAKILPPMDINGHQLFFSAQGRSALHPIIDAFLRQNGLPTWDEAATANLRARLTQQQQQDLDRYLEQETAERALAIAEDGTGRLHSNWGRGISDRARRQALKTCQEDEHKPCRLLMANFDLLPQTVSDDKSNRDE